jgi:hypothetical protein
MYTFIGTRALKVDHGAKSPEEALFIERFQRRGPSASKGSRLISQKRSLKASDMLNFIKRQAAARPLRGLASSSIRYKFQIEMFMLSRC